MIPMVDLKAQYQQLRHEIDAQIAAVLADSRFILGPNVHALEDEIAVYLGVPHAISCASGTDALHLALAAGGIGPGDEVITTTFSFIATAEAVCQVGATPVFVDIDPDTFNIDVAQVEAAITPATAAVIPVHLFGQPAEMGTLQTLCEAHELMLVEDCAQSFGASVENTRTGAIGTFGCFSFFPSKNLGCYGDGGLVSTQSPDLAERIRMLRNHGSRVQYQHDIVGFNSRLDELQAAILRVKLGHIDQFNAERQRVARRYDSLLNDLPLTTPFHAPRCSHVFHQYTLLCDVRDQLAAALRQAGIACAIYYPVPLHLQKVFAGNCRHQSLPVAESVARRCLSLPIYPEMPDDDIVRVTDVIRAALR